MWIYANVYILLDNLANWPGRIQEKILEKGKKGTATMTTGRTASNSGLYIVFQTAVLLQLPRPEELNDEILKQWINRQELLRNTLNSALLHPKVEAPTPDRFELVTTFEITVPEDCDPKSQLKSFRKKDGKSLSYFNNDITDANFANVSAQLKPGQKILVSVHRQTVSGSTTSEERMTYLRALPGNKFYGAQGTSLVYAQQRDKLEKGYAYVAMDEKDRLWVDSDGRHGVPLVYRHSGGGCRFGLGRFERAWDDSYLLLSFSDISA